VRPALEGLNPRRKIRKTFAHINRRRFLFFYGLPMINYHQRFKFDLFVKTIDGDLFRQYFCSIDVDPPDGQNINNPASVRKLIESQDEIKRLEINEEIHRIHDIAERQMERLMDICSRFGIQCQDSETPQTSAMRVFLHKSREAFDEAYDYYLYDVYVEKQYFQKQGKSGDCFIRKGVKEDKHFFIIARGDCVKTQLEFLNKRIIPRSFRPAKQDMIVFNPATSTISVTSSARGLEDKKKYVEEFGKKILGLREIPAMTFKERLVNVEPLKEKTFYRPTKDIEKIIISQIILWRKAGMPARVDIRSKDAAKVLDEIRLSFQSCDILSVVLKFKLFGVKKALQIVIKPPEHTEIKVQEGKPVVEKYLKDKGVLLV
jgi:hypothetical protein